MKFRGIIPENPGGLAGLDYLETGVCKILLEGAASAAPNKKPGLPVDWRSLINAHCIIFVARNIQTMRARTYVPSWAARAIFDAMLYYTCLYSIRSTTVRRFQDMGAKI